MKLNRIMFVLSLLGVLIAIYVLQSFLRQAPVVCFNNGCEIVRKSPASYLFGIPVPAFGLVGYALLALFAFLRTANYPARTKQTFLKVMVGIATFGFLFVSWFTYTELFVIRAICTWCAVSALNMVILFMLAVKSLSLPQKNA